MRNKYKGIVVFFTLLIILGWGVPGSMAAQEIKWLGYNEGLAAAKAEGKKIFLHFYTYKCYFCKKMTRETFTDGEIGSYLNENFIPIRVNVNRERNTAFKYRVRAVPYNVWLREDGEKIEGFYGFTPPDKFLPILKWIKGS